MNKYIFAAGFILVSASAIGATDCSLLAGTHSGNFSAEKKRAPKTMPATISGTWSVIIDSKTIKTMDLTSGKDKKTCSITGFVSSDFFGTVKVAGEYGTYSPISSSFDAANMIVEVVRDGPARFQTFALGSDQNPPAPQYININNNDYSYMGTFKADR